MATVRHSRLSQGAGDEVLVNNSAGTRQDNTVAARSNDSDGNNDIEDESTTKLIGSGLRRRKGKIISCAKETIENGE